MISKSWDTRWIQQAVVEVTTTRYLDSANHLLVQQPISSQLYRMTTTMPSVNSKKLPHVVRCFSE
eukprot:519175-Lingulodinium_polyedra.AAC.1